jgi:RNA-splicing ligase RtcB
MIVSTIKGKNNNANIMTSSIDENSIEQIKKVLDHPACTNPVAIMPDVHLGKGVVIGFTMKMNEKIVPSWVSADINCGMLFQKIKDIKNFEKYDKLVHDKVPTGMNIHKEPVVDFKNDFDWDRVNKMSFDFAKKYSEKFGRAIDLDFYRKQMKGIFTTCVSKNTLDEAPGAYKASKMIEDAIGDTCTITDHLIPLYNFKDDTKKESWKDRKKNNKTRG